MDVRYRNLDRPMIEVKVAPSPPPGRREPYGLAEAPRQARSTWTLLGMPRLLAPPFLLENNIPNGDGEERAYCGESRGVLRRWFIVRPLGGYSGT